MAWNTQFPITEPSNIYRCWWFWRQFHRALREYARSEEL